MQQSSVSAGNRVLVGRRSELAEGSQRIISVEGKEIGVIIHQDQVYAYRNRCPHQGGPVCEGIIIGKVLAAVAEDKTVLGEYFSETEPHLVCPWHGVEFHLTTGQSAVNPRLRLNRYEVVVEDDNVYVLI